MQGSISQIRSQQNFESQDQQEDRENIDKGEATETIIEVVILF